MIMVSQYRLTTGICKVSTGWRIRCREAERYSLGCGTNGNSGKAQTEIDRQPQIKIIKYNFVVINFT
jgi:hypothetical protein